MKKLIIFIGINLLINLSSFSFEKIVNKSDLKIKDAHYYINETDLYTGKAVAKRDRFYFKNGKASGKWITFYSNGNIKSITNWQDGKLNGKYVLYENNGTKSMETVYLNGKEDGYYNSYYSNGLLRVSGHYKLGKPVGTWEYFNNEGKLTGRTHVE